MEPVVLKEVMDSAIRIAIRLALGDLRVAGPRANVLELESRVAWATVAAELGNEGYGMVPPEEYAAACGLTPAEVDTMIREEGTLFALVYAADGEMPTVVPLPDRQAREQLGPIPQ